MKEGAYIVEKQIVQVTKQYITVVDSHCAICSKTIRKAGVYGNGGPLVTFIKLNNKQSYPVCDSHQLNATVKKLIS
jgi:hypothetical protein